MSAKDGEKINPFRATVLPTAAERFGTRPAEEDNPSTADAVPLPLHKGGETAEVRAEKTKPEVREESTMAEEAEPEGGKAVYDGLTEEEYDAMADVQEAEDSMAGHSMLYEDGRQFAIGKEKGVAKQDKKRYNDLDNKLKGESYADTGGYDGVRTTQLRENEKAGIYGRGNQEDVTGDSKYTKGRQRESLPSNEKENDGDAPKRGENHLGTYIFRTIWGRTIWGRTFFGSI